MSPADNKIGNSQMGDSPFIQQSGDIQETSIEGGGNVYNTFYDEKFELNDESSIETNELLEVSSKKQMIDVPSRDFQNHFPRQEIATLSPTGPLTEKRDAVTSLESDQSKEESFRSKKEPRTHNDHDEKRGNAGDLSPDLIELFKCINEYKPTRVKIEPKLKCFIPSYIPAIGEVDPFIKVPRPDGVQDGLGIKVFDEPAAQQSDAAVLELQLRTQMKKKMRGHMAAKVRSIENATKNKHEIDKWIQSVEELRISKPLLAEVKYKDRNIMPNLDQMMSPFAEELQSEFSSMFDDLNHGKSQNCMLLDPQIDLSLEEYANFICTLLDVPVVDGNLVQSLHCLFHSCFECQKDLHGDAISIL